ncbi:ABC transporter ATP-binding protein [Rhodobacter calidifons]|uniref:Spermidine/putrescine import ATP-binding protein PotA n=1 Tax=Rhodobacter calidifons TaxID=2715277 RepID=A0ABX0G1M8_9RHOB|nr:ABC transporter ATP-binding protein [Rhodobacter calidifons]
MGVSLADAVTISARNVVKAFGQGSGVVRALDDVSVDIRQGEFFTLLGPSGCGKTTLLRLIAGFEMPTEGTILLDGTDITTLPPNRRPVNTVFQSYALFPHLTVAQNISFGLEMLGKPASEVKARTAAMLALVKLEAMAGRKTSQLSGGQQQRVALARALAPQPKVLLLDEPLSALDLKLRKEMQIELKRLQLETGITFIFVTHDQEEALTMSDRIAVMSAGKIQQVGSAKDIYIHPKNRFVASFIGETNFLHGTAEAGAIRLATGERIDVPGLPAGGEATVSVRPEQVRLGLPSDGLKATVRTLVYFGTDTHCHLALADGTEVVARLQSPASGEAGLVEGQAVGIRFADGAVQRVED